MCLHTLQPQLQAGQAKLPGPFVLAIAQVHIVACQAQMYAMSVELYLLSVWFGDVTCKMHAQCI